MKNELQVEQTGYSLIPDELYEIPGLSIYAQTVYQVLCRHANAEGKCWPGHSRIASMARCSVPSVKRGIEELQKTDPPLLVVKLRSKGKAKDTNLYVVRRKDLLGGRVCQTPPLGSGRTEGRVYQSYKGRLIEGRLIEGQEPAAPAVVDRKEHYRQELENRWKNIRDSEDLQQIVIVGLERMNKAPFGNYPKEQKAAARLVQKIRTVCNGQGEREFLRALVGAYVHKKNTSKGEFWREAPFSPSGLDVRFDSAYECLRKQANDFQEGREHRELLERIMK